VRKGTTFLANNEGRLHKSSEYYYKQRKINNL